MANSEKRIFGEIVSGAAQAGSFFPICNTCKHYKGSLKCDAFDRIPDEIYKGENDHLEPLPAQGNDIVYEPK